MPQVTPWDIGDQFTKMLYDRRKQQEQMEADQYNRIAAAEITRQNADTLFQRQLARDQASQDFRHAENYLTNVVYKKGRTGRAGHLGGGGATTASTGGGNYRDAISNIESGGNYQAIGPETNGDRPYGKYQVMGSNIGPWSQEAIGRPVSVQEFLARPEIQDAIFDHRFGTYVQKYGPEGAAQAWFGGEGAVGRGDLKDVNGTSVSSYGQQFVKNLGNAGVTTTASTQRRYGTGAYGVPTTEEILAGDTGEPEGDFDTMTTPWTDEDFAANGINAWDRASIPEGNEVVGTQFFSGAQVDLMPQEMRERLLPVGGLSPGETNQYLVLRPNPAMMPQGPYDAGGQPPSQASSGTGPVIGAQSPQGTQAPAPQVQTIPSGQKTRRNAQGQLELKIDNQWVTTGG